MNLDKFAIECKESGLSIREAKEKYFMHAAYDKLWHDPMFQDFVKVYYADCDLIENKYNK